MNANDDFIVWYESLYNETKEDVDEKLVIFNIKVKSIIEINVDLMGNPYLRPYIREKYVSYITKQNAVYYINIYNLYTENIERIPCISKVAKLMSNGDFTVWLDDYDYRNIYIYNHNTKSYLKINGTLNLYTFILINNMIYISYTKDESGFANIYSYNLEDSVTVNITKNNEKSSYFYIIKPSNDSELSYQKVGENYSGIVLFNK